MSDKSTHTSTLQKNIISYYDSTRLDYRVLWANKKNRAIHFGYYDEKHASHSEALENMNRVMAREVGITSSDRVLDAGCGQGGSALWLAEKIGCYVVGVTLVPHQVEVARIEAKKRNLEGKLFFDIKDYSDTGLNDEDFSVILACESVCHSKIK
ncbi:MAG: methyltransferase domain-containing protein [Saprospiraceae bacterium]|nr:methyltransferase domain-containing protein [Saprospiraceae bacterium]